jgi:hypothetical protein
MPKAYYVVVCPSIASLDKALLLLGDKTLVNIVGANYVEVSLDAELPDSLLRKIDEIGCEVKEMYLSL